MPVIRGQRHAQMFFGTANAIPQSKGTCDLRRRDNHRQPSWSIDLDIGRPEQGMKIEIHVYLTGKDADAEVVYVDPEQFGNALSLDHDLQWAQG